MGDDTIGKVGGSPSLPMNEGEIQANQKPSTDAVSSQPGIGNLPDQIEAFSRDVLGTSQQGGEGKDFPLFEARQAISTQQDIQQRSTDDANRKIHSDGLRNLSNDEIKKQFSDSSPQQIAYVLRLLASGKGPGAKDLYEKVNQAFNEYCVEYRGDGYRMEALANAVTELKGPASSVVKGDFAAALQETIEGPGTTPDHISYFKLMTDVVKSDPTGVVEHLEELKDTNPKIMSRVFYSIGQWDNSALGDVLGKVANKTGEAFVRFNEAKQAYFEAQGSGDPAKIKSAAKNLDKAQTELISRGNDLGYAYGSARNSIDMISADKKEKVARELEILKTVIGALDFASIPFEEPGLINPDDPLDSREKGSLEAGGVLAKIGDAWIEKLEKDQNKPIDTWHNELDQAFQKILSDAFANTVSPEDAQAAPGTEEGKRVEDMQDIFENSWEDGFQRSKRQ